MPDVPPLSTISSKWSSRAAVATQDYQAGLQRAANTWEPATVGAADNYAQGVQQAIADGRFARGVQGSASNWLQRATTLGAQRFGPGVAASRNRYEQGFSPFREAIIATQLPPRGPRGSAANYQRVQTIGEALHQLRLQQLGG